MSDLTPETLAELRRKAENATPFVRPGGTDPATVNLLASDVLALLDAAAERDALRTWQERVALAAGLADEVAGYGVHLEADPDTAADRNTHDID